MKSVKEVNYTKERIIVTVEKPVQFHVLLKSIPFKCIEQKMLKLCMKNNIL